MNTGGISDTRGVPDPGAPTPDRDRLADRIARMAAITDRVPGTGCERLAFGPGEHAAHREFSRQAREAGLTVEHDRFGNTFARLEVSPGGVEEMRTPGVEAGSEAGAAPISGAAAPTPDSAAGAGATTPAILCGSHLDTVAAGGCYDGAAGVLCALEAVTTIAEAQRRGEIALTAPIEVVVWANEEGARFAPAMMGSAVYTGALRLEEALTATDREGVVLGDALAGDPDRTGTRRVPGPVPRCYLELHIEQARTLENRGLPLAVVDGVQAQIAGDWEMHGREDHAGATPMNERVDALVAAASLVARTKEIAGGDTPFHATLRGVATVGALTVRPGSRNSIPGVVTGTIDMRHPEEDRVASMATAFVAAGNDAAAAEGAAFRYTELWRAPKVTFDADLVDRLERAAQSLGVPHTTFPSAAGHDAVHLQQICPAAMLFVPSRDGVSHNPAEYTDPESLFDATRVLTVALAEIASDANNGGGGHAAHQSSGPAPRHHPRRKETL